MLEKKLRAAMGAIKGMSLPELPQEVILLQRELESKYPNMKVAADIIGQNTKLAGDVIKLANSPFMKSTEPVKSIFDAVTRLGLENIKNLVLAAALTRLAKSDGIGRIIVDHSIDVAFVMGQAAHFVQDISPEHAYMTGIFHHVGALMLAEKEPEIYEKIYFNSLSFPVNVLIKEQEAFQTNHVDIGLLIGKKWKLDNETLTAIFLHHKLQLSQIQDDNVRALVALIQLGTSLVAELSYGAYRSEEAKIFEKNAIEELYLHADDVADLRRALLSFARSEPLSLEA